MFELKGMILLPPGKKPVILLFLYESLPSVASRCFPQLFAIDFKLHKLLAPHPPPPAKLGKISSRAVALAFDICVLYTIPRHKKTFPFHRIIDFFVIPFLCLQSIKLFHETVPLYITTVCIPSYVFTNTIHSSCY